MNGFTQHYFTAADGKKIAFRRYGEGRSGKLPVMCLHGLTRNSRDFEEVAPEIAATGRTVIAIDVRGRGLSDRGTPPEGYNPATYVEDVSGLLAAEGIGRVVSVGTSMGGIITMAMAATKPGLIAGATLNDIGPELDLAGLNRIAGYVGRSKGPMASWDEAAEAIRAVNGEAFPKETGAEFWLAFARRTCRQLEDGRVELDYDPAIAEPFRQPGGAAPANMWPLFEALFDVPVLGIRGAISDLLSADTFRAMAARHPHFTGTEVPDVGHAPLLTEAPAREAIHTFLQRLD